MLWNTRYFAPGLICLTVVASGCDNSTVERKSVAGRVTVDGMPFVPDADLRLLVVFSPDASKGNSNRVSCTGVLENGDYRVRTFAITDNNSGTGVPLGWYKVYFENDSSSDPREFPFPRVYASAATTPLAVEVVDEPPQGAYDFDLKTKK